MGISYALAEFVSKTRYEDIPPHIVQTQKKAILDALAVTFGAATLGDGCKEMVELSIDLAAGGRGDATVIGFDMKLPAAWAAFANASMAHSLDYGDAHKSVIHSNTSTIPAALAVAEKLGNVDGKRFLTAVIVGSETACRLAYGAPRPDKTSSFFMPSIYTSFAATAAAASLLGLTTEQVLNAFAFTLCQVTFSAEFLNCPQSCLRSIRESFAAKAAVISAYMAQKGLIGFPQPFEGQYGFYSEYVGKYMEDAILEGLGTEFVCDRLTFKAWPCCAATHPHISAALKIIREHDVKPEEIERIHIIGPNFMEELLQPAEIRRAPESSTVAKFSIPYTLAHAVIYGGVDLDSFSKEKLFDPAIRAMARKVTYETDGDNTPNRSTDMVMYTTKGVFKASSGDPYGSPENPLTDEDFWKKIVCCLGKAYRPRDEKEAKAIADAVYGLDKAENIKELTGLL